MRPCRGKIVVTAAPRRCRTRCRPQRRRSHNERRGRVASVETVRGPVALEDLGRTLMHEHIFIMEPEALQNWGHAFGPSYWDEEERVADAVAEAHARARGRDQDDRRPDRSRARALHPADPRGGERGATSTSSSRPGCTRSSSSRTSSRYRSVEAIADAVRPRDPRGHRRHRREGGVPEVRGRAPRARRRRPADPRGGRDRRACETGAPVMVHTNAEQRTGRLALEALTRHGVDPGRIVIAHMGDSNDLDYLRTIARRRRVARLRPVRHRPLQPAGRSHPARWSR